MNKIAYSCSLFIKSKNDFFRVINDVIGVRLSVWRSCWMRVHMTHDKGQHLQYVVSADAVFSFSGRVLIDTKLSSSTFGSLHIRLIRSWCHTSSKNNIKGYTRHTTYLFSKFWTRNKSDKRCNWKDSSLWPSCSGLVWVSVWDRPWLLTIRTIQCR